MKQPANAKLWSFPHKAFIQDDTVRDIKDEMTNMVEATSQIKKDLHDELDGQGAATSSTKYSAARSVKYPAASCGGTKTRRGRAILKDIR